MVIDETFVPPSARRPGERDPSAAPSLETPSFEDALARLEVVVHELEDGKIGLAEGLGCYEEGIKLLRQCHGLLENAERRIELLSRVSVTGAATTEPFDEAAQTLEEKGAQRSRRRTRKTRGPSEAGPAAEDAEPDPPGGLF